MSKYLIRKIMVDDELVDIYAQAEAEDVKFFIDKGNNRYEESTVQAILEQIGVEIKELKENMDFVSGGGSTVIQPISFGGTGATNTVHASLNLKTSYLGEIPYGVEALAFLTEETIDNNNPPGTYRYISSSDLEEVQVFIQPIDILTDIEIGEPFIESVRAYADYLFDIDGDTYAVEDYELVADTEIPFTVYANDITLKIPYKRVSNLTYTVYWYGETGVGTGEYELLNQETRGGAGFEADQTVSVTATDKVIEGYYEFDEESSNNVLSIELSGESNNVLKLYFKAIPEPVYSNYTVKMFNSVTGEELVGDFTSTTELTYTFPYTITGVETGTTVAISANLALNSETRTYNYKEDDERNVTTLTIVEDPEANIFKLYYEMVPVYADVNVEFINATTSESITGNFDKCQINDYISIPENLGEISVPVTFTAEVDTTVTVEDYAFDLFDPESNSGYMYDRFNANNVSSLVVSEDETNTLTLYFIPVVISPPEVETYSLDTLDLASTVAVNEASSVDLIDGTVYILNQEIVGIFGSEKFLLIQQIQIFIGNASIEGFGEYVRSILMRSKVTDSDNTVIFEPWTSWEQISPSTGGGVSEVTPDTFTGILPVEKGGTGVDSVSQIANALSLKSLAYAEELIGSVNLDTIDVFGNYVGLSSALVGNAPSDLAASSTFLLDVFHFKNSHPGIGQKLLLNTGDEYFRYAGSTWSEPVNGSLYNWSTWVQIGFSGEIPVGRLDGVLPVANGGTGNTSGKAPSATTADTATTAASCTGNSATATKLATARNLQVNLASTSPASFDGSGNVTNIGVSGTLPVANGGTESTTLTDLKSKLFAAALPASRLSPQGPVHTGGFARNWFMLYSTNQGIDSSQSKISLRCLNAGRFSCQIGVSGEGNYDYVTVERTRNGSTSTLYTYKSDSSGNYKEYLFATEIQVDDILIFTYRKDSSQSKGSDMGNLFSFILNNEYLSLPRLYSDFDITNGGAGLYSFELAYSPHYQAFFVIDDQGEMVEQSYGYNQAYEETDNILYNGYFHNPVNQRGYPASGSSSFRNKYFIDRWQFSGSVTPTLDSGLRFNWSTSTANNWSLMQPLIPSQKLELLDKRYVTICALLTITSLSVTNSSTAGLEIKLANSTRGSEIKQLFTNLSPGSRMIFASNYIPYDWTAADNIYFSLSAIGCTGDIRVTACGITSYSAPVLPWQGEGTYLQELKRCYETFQVHVVDIVGIRYPNDDTRASIPAYPMRTTPTITFGGDLSFIEHTNTYTNYWLRNITASWEFNNSVRIVGTQISATQTGAITTAMNSAIYVFGTRNSALTLNAEV